MTDRREMDAALDALAAKAIMDAWQPALDELIRANTRGLVDPTGNDEFRLAQFMGLAIAEEKAQFADVFLRFSGDKRAFARQYWVLLRDLQRLMDGAGEYRPLQAFDFRGMSPAFSDAAKRVSVAAVSWKLQVMKAFFERNWNEDIGKYKDIGGGAGCGTALVVVGAVLMLLALV